MAKPSRARIVEMLLERHGRTYAAELGIDLERNSPSALYRWLCAATLLSARIGADAAMQAARALADQGWTTAQKMADASWEQRTRTLNQAGYARYDESTPRMLGDTAEMLLDKYRGDLRRLRDAAGRDPERERALLKECKGIGEVGADIFCREAQAAWDEPFPFADRRALDAAGRLGLEKRTVSQDVIYAAVAGMLCFVAPRPRGPGCCPDQPWSLSCRTCAPPVGLPEPEIEVQRRISKVKRIRRRASSSSRSTRTSVVR